MFKNSKKLLLSLLFVLTFGLVSISVPATVEAKPHIKGRVYTETGARIPPSLSAPVPDRVIWRWEENVSPDGEDWEERGGQLGTGVFSTSGWDEENSSKYFHFRPTNDTPGCTNIRRRVITIDPDTNYPGTFTTANEYTIIRPGQSTIVVDSLDEAYRRIGNNEFDIWMRVNYLTPTQPPIPPQPLPLSCRNLTLTRTAMMAGENTTLTSEATGEFDSAWYTVFNRDNMRPTGGAFPVCVSGGNGHPDCPPGSSPLTISGQRGSNNTASTTITYEQINIVDLKTNQRLIRPSFTAYFSRNGQITPPVAACIKNLDLVSCGGVTPTAVNLSPTTLRTQVNATSIPNSGLEDVRYGLYSAGVPVCGDPTRIDDFPELISRPDTRCPPNQQHILIDGYVQNTGESLVGTGDFNYETLRNFVQSGQNYNFTAFVKVSGREVGSQQQCIGSLRVTIPNPPPTAAICRSKEALNLNNVVIPENTALTPGTEFKYRINLTNPSNRAVTITDTVPSQLQITAIESPASGCTVNGQTNTVSCTGITGTSVVFKVKIRDNATGGFTNRARVTDALLGIPSTCTVAHTVTPSTPQQCGQTCTVPDAGGQGNCAAGFICDNTRTTPLCVIPECQGQQCTCTPPTTPPTNAPGPMCLRIALNAPRTPPQIGDSVNLTCGRVNYPNVSYQFRYRRNAGEWQNVQPATTGSNISQNFTITDWGTFDAQCRLCVGGSANIQGTCQEWQNPITR